jgi:endonuclease YncB( thermonuclease family)
MGAFFMLSPIICYPLSACSLDQSSQFSKKSANQKLKVKFVYDGDTFYLDDGRKVRIIGIDTPELKRPTEAFSSEARDALRGLLASQQNQVYLQAGKDAYDHYGRLLAHVFLSDGRNVAEWMLSHGFATLLLIPPNVGYLNCYAKAEEYAQNLQLNLWTQRHFKLYIADLLDKQHTGYTRLVARITTVEQHKHSAIIYLRGGLRVKINATDLAYFSLLDWDKLAGQRVSVTGILRKKGKFRTLHIRHPIYFRLSQ